MAVSLVVRYLGGEILAAMEVVRSRSNQEKMAKLEVSIALHVEGRAI